ncbi:MAG TPA: cytochrome c biogenesis protein CcsA, partial [Hyphomicrobiaceae bacterium]|nr:cytochrome c biogenesis protein CcsA [Hyphomicrobiaceae bacterium]
MLEAAEAILVRDGIAALTLRAAARAAGVSHAAPKNHFGDLSGLLSELAAVGYRRLADMMQAASGGAAASAGAGRAYVKFAIANPGLFQLMFRGERLDYGRPALKEASDRAFGFLMCDPVPRDGAEALDLDAAAGILQRWSAVHGLAMLLITGAIWANESWGRPWGFDSKETGALVAWLTYAAFLHTRISRGW